jgi:glutathione synthetase
MSSNSTEDASGLSEEHILALLGQIQDWQINHGSLLKLIGSQTEHSVLSYPVGVTVFPSVFPRLQFYRAIDLQPIYNELYATIAVNEEWLYNTTKELISVEPLANALWDIHKQAKRAGTAQEISAGIFRSDYMLHLNDDSSPEPLKNTLQGTLKQVEFNAFSCAGASHAKRVADMHRYMTRIGAYDLDLETQQSKLDTSSLPQNDNIESIASFLASAHTAYGPPKCKAAKQTAVLYIVQPKNFNVADERPIEYSLWNRDEPVPTYRLNWGDDILQCTSLTESRELLFHPPWSKARFPVEVSVIYLRAGYEAYEYDVYGREARMRLEMSSAIKCPSILSHISTFKKVQQALTAPGEIERFLSPQNAAILRETFVMAHPLDSSSEGLHARELVRDQDCSNYILKPSLEGGGHNIYDRIPEFLGSIPVSRWSSYILMERIQPPVSKNVLMGPAGVDGGQVVSELGIFGACLWKSTTGDSLDLLYNSCSGWSFKTKHADVDEMSVVKGYGCFDTPRLIEG